MSEVGRTKLTRRGLEIARLVALGLTNRQIAQHLSLSERTVEWHVDQILNRFGYSSRSQLAAWVGRTQPSLAIRPPGQRVRSNLPAHITRFVGRERDLAALQAQVAASRLVTVVGAGGIGKTRLALQLAEQLEPAIADGVWLCQLAPLAEGDLIPDSIAQTLGVKEQLSDRLNAVRDHLRERTVLLVLDNCEHLLPAVSRVATDLLTACSGLQILATSRTQIGIAGEVVWQVGPLNQADAVRLLVERAKDAVPGFEVEANHSAMETVCRRLDGVPLALELAASRLRVLSVAELADAVLAPQLMHDSPSRHSSLEGVADWSYRLLQPDAQMLFRRLSVFAHWFDAHDAAALAPAATDVGKLLADLVESSMLIHERRDGTSTQYRLLEVLKPFARARLAGSDEAAQARLAHAERVVELAERMDLRRDEHDPNVWPKVARMIDDVRAALATLLELQPSRAAWLAAAASGIWLDSGRLDEGLRWAAAALEAQPHPSVERCWLLHTNAWLLFGVGRSDAAELAFRDAQSLTSLPECDRIRGDLLLVAANVHVCRGDYKAADAAQRKAVEVFTNAGLDQKAARALNHLALSLLFQGRLEEARALAAQSVDLRRRNGSRVQPALDTLAQALALLGDLDQARQSWIEAATLALRLEDATTVLTSLEGLAYIAGERGHSEEALLLHSCADHFFSKNGARYDEPLAPKVRDLVSRLNAEVGTASAARLVTAGEELTPSAAVALAAAHS
ncbi:MAG: hypothetical protein NVS1B3_07560 [Candidatus Dormibacteraceae bacterium]